MVPIIRLNWIIGVRARGLMSNRVKLVKASGLRMLSIGARSSRMQSRDRFRAGVLRGASLLLGLMLAAPLSAFGQQTPSSPPATSPPAQQASRIAIVLAREIRDLPAPLSLLDARPEDDGLAGARLGIRDNNTTGRFLKQEFDLDLVEADNAETLVAEVEKRVADGAGFVVTDVSAQTVI